MGADLLLTALVHDEDKKLDWKAGREVVRKMPAKELMAALEEINGEACETLTEARREANAIISDLKRELANIHARDAYLWRIRGAALHIRGGTSWGEDPSDGWTTFANAHHFPEALRAIGFEVGPDERGEDGQLTMRKWARSWANAFEDPDADTDSLLTNAYDVLRAYAEKGE